MDIDAMTDEELSELIESASSLLARRQTVAAIDRQVEDVLRAARTEGVIETPVEGEAWAQPVGAHDAYLAGDVVTHDRKTWTSLINYNVWEPGVSGWRELSAEADDEATVVPKYVAPTGAHDVYMSGDRVTFEGDVYEAVTDNVTWSPSEHPPAWRKVE